MAGKSILSSQILVPLSGLTAIIGVTLSVSGWGSSRTQDIAVLRVQVNDLTVRVEKAESRQDKSDERWDQIRDDLAKIRERLGIAEAKVK